MVFLLVKKNCLRRWKQEDGCRTSGDRQKVFIQLVQMQDEILLCVKRA